MQHSYASKLKEAIAKGSTVPVRAVIYARVSTELDSQKESCPHQVTLAKSYIAEHPNIELVKVYVDDGISGKNDFTRPQYGEMCALLAKNGFDIIITKSLSRLNRDEYNSMGLTNLLVAHNATVLTLEDGQVHDFEDINSGIIHSIEYAIDAQYVKRQSLSGKLFQEQRCAEGILMAKDTCFGYTWDRATKTISINEDEAAAVREAFSQYVYMNGSPGSISKYLKSKGYDLCNVSVSNLIQNERYIGKFYINKRGSRLGTGQTKSTRFDLPKEDWVLVERPDLQIVDTEVFEMAQRIHQLKVHTYDTPDNPNNRAHFMGTHLFSGRVFCPRCGKAYSFRYTDRKQEHAVYTVRNHSECSGPVDKITEQDLIGCTRAALRQITSDSDRIAHNIERVLTFAVKKSQDPGNDREVWELRRQKAAAEKEIDNLLDSMSLGGLNTAAAERINARISEVSQKVDELDAEIREHDARKLDTDYVRKKTDEIAEALTELCKFRSLTRDDIMTYIDRIELPWAGVLNIIFKTGHYITVTTQYNSPEDTGDAEDVERPESQDALSFCASNIKDALYLTSVTTSPSPWDAPEASPITINCYLRAEKE